MEHQPVMLAECLQQLAIKTDGVYLDCTFGRGGHSLEILKQLGEKGKLLAFDRDNDAIHSERALALSKDMRFTLTHCWFSRMAEVVESQGLSGQIDGILMDLGVSSPQLDTPERGFSFLRNGNLDMRMDSSTGLSAQDWLSSVDEKTLIKVLFDYGEERFAKRIAAAVVARRAIAPITSTIELAKLVEDAVPFKEKHKHPATRTFQAIRIAVNQELDELTAALQQAVQVLKPQGRLVVISFHSLEDRIVKRFIRDESGNKFDAGKLPIKESDMVKGSLKKVGKALKASPDELATNIRARSAVMRIAERI
ncbi:16S rRNA (cytosine(1402)-N(4))-methyltransferase RsmH [Methylosoma difficile]